jgi:hypothetical protein
MTSFLPSGLVLRGVLFGNSATEPVCKTCFALLQRTGSRAATAQDLEFKIWHAPKSQVIGQYVVGLATPEGY